MEGNCKLCNRVKWLTFHHLIPKTCHSNKWFKKNFTRKQLKENGFDVCWDCHRFIHITWEAKELGRYFNTFEKINNDKRTKKFVKYIRKRK